MPECLGDDFILSRDARLLPPVSALSVKVFRVPIRRYANTVCGLCPCSWFLVSSLEVTLLSLQYFALVTENTDITTITIGFNSFYHQISRDGEAGKYLLLHRK